ncbi:hypothetical protein [Magnetospirillum sp. 15-1]|uniref:hypothetical protein n=1 Tax=Magnetospirillum sp. 15-1 TaxID=1979370 RepID=UPI00148374F5|nr:hypothetical protein [Magnetospirillum sp. 15-1]MDO8608835.1 hypothetical protein [Phaeospirillum sp.]
MTGDLKRALATYKSQRGKLLIELTNGKKIISKEMLQEIATLQGVIAAIEAELAE